MMIEPWLRAWLPEGGRLALDIGANVGTWTVWLAGRFEQVHAFEPNPEALLELRKHADRATIIDCAVGDQPGEQELRLYAHSVHASLRDRDEIDAQGGGNQLATVLVPVVTLDGLGYQDQPIEFIKIDTEGYEDRVLQGAVETVRASGPRLLIEVHAADTGDRCVELLGQYGYRLERIPHPHRGVPAGHHWLHAQPDSGGR